MIRGGVLAHGMTTKLVIKRRSDAQNTPPLDEINFTGPIVTIGSDTGATICLNDSSVAAEQAVIISEGAQLLLMNRGAGTSLNNESLPREALRPLVEGDCLYIGDYAISVITSAANVSANTNAQSDVQTSVPTDAASLQSSQLDALFASGNGSRPITDNLNQPPEAAGGIHRSFAAILDSLRTEEDSFYFTIQGGLQTGVRIPIEAVEIPLGWDESGQRLVFDHRNVFAPCAVVRKDWSGVVFQAHASGIVSINEQPIESVQRLRNGDRLTVVPTGVTIETNAPTLIFHEPASLIVLDSLLPQSLPPPVVSPPSPSDSATPIDGERVMVMATVANVDQTAGRNQSKKGRWRTERNYFGYFTLLEMLLMVAATVAAAALIFFLLRLFLS